MILGLTEFLCGLSTFKKKMNDKYIKTVEILDDI